jgi:hypothetical protein
VFKLRVTVGVAAASQGLAVHLPAALQQAHKFEMLLAPILCPISRNAAASFAWLLHRNGRIGSPFVAGSSN